MNIFKKLFNKKKIEKEYAEDIEYINRKEEFIEFVKQGGVIVYMDEKYWNKKFDLLYDKGIDFIFDEQLRDYSIIERNDRLKYAVEQGYMIIHFNNDNKFNELLEANNTCIYLTTEEEDLKYNSEN